MNIFSGFISIQGIPFLMLSSFVCIFLGLLLGRIKIKKVCLGSSAVFIISLIYGAIFSSHIKSTISQKSKDGKKIDISSNGLKILENIGLILFIGSVGFKSGSNFFKNFKKNFKSYIVIGLLIILITTILCIILFYIGKSSAKNMDEFTAMMVGIFSGALTSTPAFSAAKSSVKDEYEYVVSVGYGLAYIFGVLGIVIFVQIVPKIIKADIYDEINKMLGKDKDYKISKRIRTDRTESTKMSRETQKINVSKNRRDRTETFVNLEKEIKQETKKSKFSSGEKNEDKIVIKEKIMFENKNILSSTERKIKLNENITTEKDKENINNINEEEKEIEENNPEKE